MSSQVFNGTRQRATGILVLAAIFVFLVPFAQAHTQSTAFLSISANETAVTGEWHLALRDLDDAIGLDSDDDGAITWDELRAHSEALRAYALSRLQIASESGPAGIRVTNVLVETHSDGATYAVLRFKVDGVNRPSTLTVTYKAFFDMDAKHRGLLRVEHLGLARTAVFSPETQTQRFALGEDQRQGQPVLIFVREGVWHIWHGYDHILFLLALLLPGVLCRSQGSWQPVSELKPAVLRVIKIVTAFTAAHSITLSLAAFGIVHLPGRLVEAAIAGSVVVAALNNIFPLLSGREWIAAFGFGLLHGFGFANALGDLGLRSAGLAIPLLGFNFGVELGQLAIVLGFLPLAFSIRRLYLYPPLVLQAGSALIMTVAGTWFAERVLDFKWLPF